MKDRNIVSKEENKTELKLEKKEILDILFYARIGILAMQTEIKELYEKIEKEDKRLRKNNCNY